MFYLEVWLGLHSLMRVAGGGIKGGLDYSIAGLNSMNDPYPSSPSRVEVECCLSHPAIELRLRDPRSELLGRAIYKNVTQNWVWVFSARVRDTDCKISEPIASSIATKAPRSHPRSLVHTGPGLKSIARTVKASWIILALISTTWSLARCGC